MAFEIIKLAYLLAWLVCVSVCLSVCLSVCPLACVKKRRVKLHEIFCSCYPRPWIGPPAVITTQCTSGFVYDVMFAQSVSLEGRIENEVTIFTTAYFVHQTCLERC